MPYFKCKTKGCNVRSNKLEPSDFPLVCACGTKYELMPETKNAACKYRGEKIGQLEIKDCNDWPNIYTCELYERCVLIRDSGKREKAISKSKIKICRECENAQV